MRAKALNRGITTVAAVLLFAACSSNICGPADDGYCGHVTISGSVKSDIKGSAAGSTSTLEGVQIPSAEDFALDISGSDDYQMHWESVALFNRYEPYLAEGEYTLTISYGDKTVEDFDNPCFEGSATAVVKARKTSEATITARIVNSLIVIECTDNFSSYFPSSEFVVTTSAGGTFSIEPPMQGSLFVAPESKVQVVCTARKQTGETVTFPAQEIEMTAPQTRYTLRYDVEQAGGSKLQITLNDETTEEIDIDAELNEFI